MSANINNSTNNKRIVKNTLFMYFRMGITMVVGLYTSRIVLRQLGVEDYGLYNVTGGIIAMFGFLNSSMTNATSRFITFYLAKGNNDDLRNIFSMASLIHICIAVMVLILGETVGLWYLNNKFVMPEEREFAVRCLYQLSILSSCLSVLYVPYNATIVAHEKMSAFAYISIMDVVLKLIIVLLLAVAPFDKLIFYSTLLCAVSVLDLLIYFIYCKRNFLETKFKYYWNSSIFKDMMDFMGWALIGNFSYIFYSQGINLMLNAFCGPSVNAARGIAVQVEGVVKQFASNVQMAINPQIIKSYASNEMERMYSLIFSSSRYCFYLLFILSLPIFIEAEFILNLWLGQVPKHTVNFVRLILSISLFDAFINPMFTANLASGKLKLYNLSVCIVSYSFMIITYLSIWLSHVPESVFYCLLISTIIGVAIRIYVLYRQIGLLPIIYLQKVIYRVIVVVLVAIAPPVLLYNIMDYGWIRFLSTSFIAVLSVAIFVYTIGINQSERTFIIDKLRCRINNNHNDTDM